MKSLTHNIFTFLILADIYFGDITHSMAAASEEKISIFQARWTEPGSDGAKKGTKHVTMVLSTSISKAERTIQQHITQTLGKDATDACPPVKIEKTTYLSLIPVREADIPQLFFKVVLNMNTGALEGGAEKWRMQRYLWKASSLETVVRLIAKFCQTMECPENMYRIDSVQRENITEFLDPINSYAGTASSNPVAKKTPPSKKLPRKKRARPVEKVKGAAADDEIDEKVSSDVEEPPANLPHHTATVSAKKRKKRVTIQLPEEEKEITTNASGSGSTS